MNIDIEENGGKKDFSGKSRPSTSCIPIWKHDYSANKKKNGDYYEYPCLSYFLDELCL